MQQHDIEIEIHPNGQVKVHIKGVKGKQCLEYGALFEQIVGQVKDQSLTSEYYEPGGNIKIHVAQEQRRG